MSVSILPGGAADAERVGRLHYAVWVETYRDLAPAAIKEKLTEAVRIERWRGILAEPRPHQGLFLAVEGDRLLGFAMGGQPSEAEFEGRGEVKFLYVAQAAQGRGIGRALLGTLARHLVAQGYDRVALGVLQGNDPAIRFYQRLGGRHLGDYTDPGPTWRSTNHVYAWDEPEALIRLAPAAAS